MKSLNFEVSEVSQKTLKNSGESFSSSETFYLRQIWKCEMRTRHRLNWELTRKLFWERIQVISLMGLECLVGLWKGLYLKHRSTTRRKLRFFTVNCLICDQARETADGYQIIFICSTRYILLPRASKLSTFSREHITAVIEVLLCKL